MKSAQIESVYQALPGTTVANSKATVTEFLTEFIRPTSDASDVLKEMKPVHVDKSNTFVKEDEIKEQKRERKRKKDYKLTAKEKRRLKVYEIPKEAYQYELFVPLSELWQDYMEKLLDQGTQNFEQKLIKADLHGAPFTIIQSTNPTYVGVTGIVVQETLSMFKIITKENKLKQIPKNSSIFSVRVNKTSKDYKLYGQQFISRPSERAVKKFKPKATIDL